MAHKVLTDPKLWKCIQALLTIDGPTCLETLSRELEQSIETTLLVVDFLGQLQAHIDVQAQDGKLWVQSVQVPKDMNLQISFRDWLALQAHFPEFEKTISSQHFSFLEKRFATWESDLKSMDLFSALDTLAPFFEQQESSAPMAVNGTSADLIKCLESAIIEQKWLDLKLKKVEKGMTVFPFRLVDIEGKLSLLAEEYVDQGLLAACLDDIETIEHKQRMRKRPKSLDVDLDEFLRGLRKVHEEEIRLVLKVYDPTQFDSTPKFHFIDRPSVVINDRGHMIWVATVNPTQGLFQWIAGQSENVVILSPASFRESYLTFQDSKASALKKAG